MHPAFTSLLLVTLFAADIALAQVPSRNMILRAHKNDYYDPTVSSSYSACWSYVHPDGREYAVIGTRGGTAIYNVTNPGATSLAGFIPGPPCLWREMKSYGTWIYVVTECLGANQGLQIISMANPQAPVLSSTYEVTFNRSHTISVDTSRGLLVCNGTRNAANQATGMRILSLASPGSPLEIGRWPGGPTPVSNDLYVHDSVPIGNRLYASSINSGFQRILDFTNPASPTEIHSWTYTGAFTHNAWPDAAGNRLYVTDEVRGQRLKVFDITTPTDPVLVHTFTPNPGGIVHNAHVLGDELFLANYSEGVRVLDLSDPAHPAEFAWADTYAGLSGAFNGVWEFCPFFPSGTAIASDMNTGLYVFEIDRDYGLLTVEVTEAGVDTPLVGANVTLLEQGDLRETDQDGTLRFGPSPGTHTVRIEKFGFDPFETEVTVASGGSETITAAIVRKPVAAFSGIVQDQATLLSLEDAEVALEETPLHEHTDGAGQYAMANVPEDTYAVSARRPGYVPVEIERLIASPGATQEFRLWPAEVWDDLEAPSGWVVGTTGDNATTGIWVRVDPLGTGTSQGAMLAPASSRGYGRQRLDPLHEGHETDGALAVDVQPDSDRTPSAGVLCFVTGQGTDPANIGQQDVDNGVTTLTSPAFDATGLVDPALGYWQWFYSNSLADDFLIVYLSNNNGASWSPVDTTWGIHNHWEERMVRIADHFSPTSQMRLRFVAGDTDPQSVVEAAIDDVVLVDLSLPVVGVSPQPPSSSRFSLRLTSANPAVGQVAFKLESLTGRDVEVVVIDVRGRIVRTIYRGGVTGGSVNFHWDGKEQRDQPSAAGIYYVVARSGMDQATTRFVKLP